MAQRWQTLPRGDSAADDLRARVQRQALGNCFGGAAAGGGITMTELLAESTIWYHACGFVR